MRHVEGGECNDTPPDKDVACVGRDGGDRCDSPSDYVGDGECDPFSQDDCPDGERCVPWANDGGNSWNSTRCSPVDAAPDAIGEACTVEGTGVSGIDSCEAGAMCWDVDGETNTGTCIELCGCGPIAPTCNGMNVVCTVSNEGSLPICLPTCDPLLQDECPEGQGCYAVDDFFTCAPDASGDQGVAGSPCEFINACGPGLLCAATAQIPGCVGSGCCTEFCDVDEGDDACSLPGTSCIPLFEPGTEPEACHADSGACLAPT